MYNVVAGKVEIDLGILRIPEFKAIWNRDDSIDKVRANAELDFIYQLCDYRSNYRKTYRDEELLEAVTKDFVSRFDNWIIDTIMNAAIEKYVESRETSSYKDFKAIDRSMGEIRKLCNSFAIDPNEELGMKEKLEIAKLHLSLVSSYEGAITAMVNIKKKISEDMAQLEAVSKGGTKIRDRERYINEQRQHS